MLRGVPFKNIANFKKAHPLRQLIGWQVMTGNKRSNYSETKKPAMVAGLILFTRNDTDMNSIPIIRTSNLPPELENVVELPPATSAVWTDMYIFRCTNLTLFKLPTFGARTQI
ncbi:MAG: hypothetical protein A3A08_02025 [Candidatus Nealsonbacteria bacterium RIFCSPLOWO2_01_FULL_41_9]|uniref:Uncharacterized protein n=1 Tax=Candidatus Nealsonbacteria bacterium RIFCSPLOWO2_01_FULL_41_9 TaxID=1801671 RepID=A0A1G2EAJ9_9BACT|nr:MAG: hypothetical protein A3A08_02025 [Candidatus Nealsonbacteria bacterium RIFCSPLOWO2_01_FULL_41_9]